MRVIFRSAATPAAVLDPRDGTSQEGVLHFELVLLEEGEDLTPPVVQNMARTAGAPIPRVGTHRLRELRARAAGGPIVIPAPSTEGGSITIPEGVLARLPESAEFVLRWQLNPTPQQ